MNTQFLTRSAKAHGSKIAWGSVFTVLLALVAGWNDNRSTNVSNHDETARWHQESVEWREKMEARIEALEEQDSYNKGVIEGLKEGLTEKRK
jgi:hypothetical protein